MLETPKSANIDWEAVAKILDWSSSSQRSSHLDDVLGDGSDMEEEKEEVLVP